MQIADAIHPQLLRQAFLPQSLHSGCHKGLAAMAEHQSWQILPRLGNAQLLDLLTGSLHTVFVHLPKPILHQS
jgi:hypothetical protein